jgi:hypothetical protein
MMTPPQFDKILYSSVGYGLLTGIGFGMKYHSLQVGLLASLICGLMHGGVLAWRNSASA